MSKSRKYVESRAHFLNIIRQWSCWVFELLGSDVGLFVCFSRYVDVSSSLSAYKSSLIVPKQDHRFTRFNPKTRSYLSHKSIPRSLSVCQTPNHVTNTFPISGECLCIPCHFLSFEQNNFFFILKWSCIKLQLDFRKSQFYNDIHGVAELCFRMNMANERLHYMKLTYGKINNSNAYENVACCYKYSFLWNYCVTTCRFANLTYSNWVTSHGID